MPGFRPRNGCFPGRFRPGLSGGLAWSLHPSPGGRFSAPRGLPAALRRGGPEVVLRRFISGDFAVPSGDVAVAVRRVGGDVRWPCILCGLRRHPPRAGRHVGLTFSRGDSSRSMARAMPFMRSAPASASSRVDLIRGSAPAPGAAWG